ncbi:MAG: NYN domain-containing protein [bacterium]|nr:NYN domain-containing protein [bacterium]
MSEKIKAVIKNNRINTPTAIFIDGDWLYTATRRINRKVDYAKFFSILIKKFGTNTKIYFYGAINSADKKQTRFYTLLKKIGYQVSCTELIKREDFFISKGLEVQLSVDAMQRLPSFKKFVLVSGDGDFAPLLKKIIDNRIDILVISLPFTTGYQLRRIAGGAFLNLEVFISERKDTKKLQTFKKEAEVERFVDQNYIKKGDSFKSYIKLRNLMESAKNSIIIIDSYVDDQIPLMIQPLKPKISKIIITDTDRITLVDFFVQIKKLKQDGHLIDIYKSKKFHDRFICIDDIWWHSGHSFKNLGEKDSMLSKVTKENAQKINDEVIEIANKK